MFEKKTDTSCSRCILAMFFKRLKSSGKFYTYFSNVKQRANFQNSNSVFGVCKSYSRLHFWLNNQAFVIALNKVPKNRNMFWQCFWRCLEKTETSCSRCILAMFIKRLKSSGNFSHIFSNVKQRANFQNSNSVFGVCKSYSGLHFWLNNQAFVIALNKVPKTKNIM